MASVEAGRQSAAARQEPVARPVEHPYLRAVAVLLFIALAAAPFAITVAAPRIATFSFRRPAITVAATAPGLATTSGKMVSAGAALPAASGVVPTLPAGRHTAPSLSGLIDNLPIVVRTLPDQASQRAVADYDHATFLNTQGAAQMFIDAWNGLDVPAADASASNQAVHDLISATSASLGQGSTLDSEIQALLQDLTQDPLNADRLSNAAVALYDLSAGMHYVTPSYTIGDYTLGDPLAMQQAAIDLIGLTHAAFPSDRAATLNAVTLLPGDAQTYLPSAQPMVSSFVGNHPNDVTARLLLGELQGQSVGNSADVSAAQAVMNPLINRAITAATGYMGLGDIDLAAASAESARAPFYATQLTRQALDAYDHALTLNRDPGLFAGRAGALAALGYARQAVDAQRIAVGASPQSIDLLGTLALYQGQAGDAEGMRASAARALALATQGWDPDLSHIAFTSDKIGQLGLTGASFGSNLDHIAPPYGGGGGGGFAYLLDTIPPAGGLGLRPGFPPDEAIDALLQADLLTGNAQEASSAEASWWQHEQAYSGLVHSTVELPITQESDELPLVAAVGLVAGGPVPEGTSVQQGLDEAAGILAGAGRFRDAEQLCQRVAASAAAGSYSAGSLLSCVGTNAYYAGRDRQAEQAFLQSYRAEVASGGQETPEIAAADIAAQIGDRATATRLLTSLADASTPGGGTNQNVIAVVDLGDLSLDAGDVAGALRKYNSAWSQLRSGPTPSSGPSVDDATLTIEQHLYNNQGLALLLSVQPNRAQPPECKLHVPVCRQAADDFARALAIDPANPLYLFNSGWVARLLGEEAKAIKILGGAVKSDPTLYPALNDRGVLEAEAGKADAARRDFEAALAVDPKYDLAAWNLGVYWMHQGPLGALRAQPYLAKAISESPSLRGNELDYRTDERAYRFVARRGRGTGWSMGRDYSLATTAVGWLALLLAVIGIFKIWLTHKAEDRLAEVWDERLPELEERIAWRRRLRFVHLRLWTRRLHRLSHPRSARAAWMITAPVLVATTGYTAWRFSGGIGSGVVAVALTATATAVASHELGHIIAARLLSGKVSHGYWRSGVLLSLGVVLLPVEMGLGPYVGHAVESRTARRKWWISFAGPLANLAMAAACYALFIVEPLPVLRVMAQAQLAVCAYALLPMKPLDGEELKKHRWVVLSVSLLLVWAGIAFTAGYL